MIYKLLPDNPGFPSPAEAEPDGLLAVGGDLSVERLVNAYALGIFPWYSKKQPLLWWSLDPRMVLFPCKFRYSDSLRRIVNTGRFKVSIDTAFDRVIRACASTPRSKQHGTWITPEMQDAYIDLHHLGLAHSFETYLDGQLVGGLYGVSLGDYFCGESMFHTYSNASKVAFVKLVEFCTLHGFRFIDAQQPTRHLSSLGASPIPRADFLDLLNQTDFSLTMQHSWNNNTLVLLLGSNEGNRLDIIKKTFDAIENQIGHISRVSKFYQSEPWGFSSNNLFINVAVTVETCLSPHDALDAALSIETQLGRQRPATATTNEPRTFSDRPIDIDLIFYNSIVIDTPTLQLPHPRLHLRRFALLPLADICPDFIHPLLHRSIAQLLQQCTDTSLVSIY